MKKVLFTFLCIFFSISGSAQAANISRGMAVLGKALFLSHQKQKEYLTEEEQKEFIPICFKQMFQQCVQAQPSYICSLMDFNCICSTSAKELKRSVLFPENETVLKENEDKMLQIFKSCLPK